MAEEKEQQTSQSNSQPEEPENHSDNAPEESEQASGNGSDADNQDEKDAQDDQQGFKIKKVLLLEDERVSQRLISSILEKKGFEVELAENGKIALRKLSEFEPDLFIIDLNMPVMGGLEFLKYLREKKKYLMKPVLILTAQRDKESIIKAANLGIDGYIAKPINLKVIEEKLSNIQKPEAPMRRMINLKNIISKLVNKIESQEAELKNAIEMYDKKMAELDNSYQDKLNQMKSLKCETKHSMLKEMEVQHHKQKELCLKKKKEAQKTIESLKIEKEKLSQELHDIDEMIKSFTKENLETISD